MAGWKPKFFVVGTATYLGATGCGYLYFKGRPSSGGEEGCAACAGPVNLRKAVDGMASDYDSQIGLDERLMGVGMIRWWMLRSIRGNVLEIGCGTGRNMPYYSEGAAVTAVDLSPPMLAVAARKIEEHSLTNIELAQADAQELQYPDSSFDVVVDTFGLCSYPDPAKVLAEMQRVCKPSGEIVLIEHGQGSYGFLNGLLDDGALQHASKWGCWWNRPIESMVADSGLAVSSLWRWHFGTTYVITASPNKTK